MESSLFENKRLYSNSALEIGENPYSKIKNDFSRNYTVEPAFTSKNLPKEYNAFESGSDSIFLGNKRGSDTPVKFNISEESNPNECKNIYQGLKSGIKTKPLTSYTDKELLIQYYLSKKRLWNSSSSEKKSENKPEKTRIKITKSKLMKAAELKVNFRFSCLI